MNKRKNYINKELKDSLEEEFEKVNGGKTEIDFYGNNWIIKMDAKTGLPLEKPKKKEST